MRLHHMEEGHTFRKLTPGVWKVLQQPSQESTSKSARHYAAPPPYRFAPGTQICSTVVHRC